MRRYRPRFILFAAMPMIAVAAVLVYVSRPEKHPLPPDTRADRLLVEKGKRRLTLHRGSTVLKQYRVSLGKNPIGHKRAEGDKRTPEGLYVVDWHNPNSRCHLSVHISYPDQRDRQLAASRGVSPGDYIMIHGLVNGLGWLGRLHRLRDWTDGCIAVTNGEMNEIYAAVDDGTPIEIRP